MWAIHHVDNLPFSVSGRVALMGDAVSVPMSLEKMLFTYLP